MKCIPIGAGKRMLFATITRGKGTRYSRSMFVDALQWEKPIIMEAEEEFSKVREASTLLARSGRRLGWVKKAVARGVEIEGGRLDTILQEITIACRAVKPLTRGD
jgi:hypothetical protein